MKKIKEDFISNEEKDFRFKIGNLIASSLSGFIGGMIAALIIAAAAVIFVVFVLNLW